jgi:hypothetical protein
VPHPGHLRRSYEEAVRSFVQLDLGSAPPYSPRPTWGDGLGESCEPCASEGRFAVWRAVPLALAAKEGARIELDPN